MTHLRDFMCDCESNPEGQKKCADLMQRVYADLKAGPEDLLTKVVYNLEWGLPDENGDRYIGSIEGIGCDMWCGVSAHVQRWDKEVKKYTDHASIFVQCDKVEHGIARVWELAMQSVKGEP